MSAKLTPVGSAPDSLRLGVGLPVVVMVMLKGTRMPVLVELALVMVGGALTVTVQVALPVAP